jgi:DNA-binding Lrp family transcriptional regulator
VQPNRPLDAIDRKIVALLQKSAKRTFADIGLDVGLSATAVKRRVDRLGRSLAKVDEIVSAFTVSGEADAVIRVRVDSIDHLERLVERLRRDPNIVRTRTLIVLSTLLDRA